MVIFSKMFNFKILILTVPMKIPWVRFFFFLLLILYLVDVTYSVFSVIILEIKMCISDEWILKGKKEACLKSVPYPIH